MLNIEEIILIYIRKHKYILGAVIKYHESITQKEIYAMPSITQKTNIGNEFYDFTKKIFRILLKNDFSHFNFVLVPTCVPYSGQQKISSGQTNR